MMEGLELQGYRFTWITQKPYWKYPRQSRTLFLEGSKCFFQLLYTRPTSADYEIRICNNRSPRLSVQACIENPKTYEEYGRIDQIITGSESIGVFHVDTIAEDMIGFHAMKFLKIRIVIHSESLQLGPQGNNSPEMPMKNQGSPCNDNRLSVDLGKLLKEGQNHDVKLTCPEGPSIKAHSLILSARSPVFRKMFQPGWLEDTTRSVEITDMEADVLQGFVEYLYTGHLEMSTDNAQGFYQAGSKYIVEGMVKDCADFLINTLTEENAFEILIFADVHSDQRLKEATISYMLDKSIPSLEERWEAFAGSHPKLAYDVLYRSYKTHRDN